MDLLIGTHNPGKVREFQELLADAPVRVIGLDEVGLGKLAVDENGETFAENAEHKALTYARASGLFALGDDSGLMVDALDGRPGLYSARYGGEGLDERGRRLKLLGELEKVPDEQRTARFVCVIAVASPQTMTCVTSTGYCEGHIARADDDGPYGFGYDAIFIPVGYRQPFSQLGGKVKHPLSHRGEAARKLIPVLKRLANEQS